MWRSTVQDEGDRRELDPSGAGAGDEKPMPEADPSSSPGPVRPDPDGDVELDEIVRWLAEDEDAPSEVESRVYSLQEFAAYVPAGAIEFVRSLTRTEWLATCTLAAADEHYCRRLGEHTVKDRQNRWNGAWTKRRRSVEARLRRARDEQARRHHAFNVGDHETFRKLPGFFKPWRPNADGRLLVHDPDQVNPSIGSPGFLEQTPVKVLRWVHETWLSNRGAVLEDGDVSLSDVRPLRVWDLTAGSGTGMDYFGRICGCKVYSRDLTVVASDVDCGCFHDFHVSDKVTGRSQMPAIHPGLVIRHPDIILFDPPSRGTPTHAELYGDRDEDDEADARDLALADRQRWIDETTRIAKRTARYLAKGGVISFLVRHGERNGRTVVDDPGLLDAVKLELVKPGPGRLQALAIAHEMPIVCGRRRNQASLGQARVPATHLLLVRASG
jgi:hypothetical protein